MNSEKVDMFIVSNGNKFPMEKTGIIRDTLLNLPDSKWNAVSSMQFKDPTVILVVSLLAGVLGVDRFMIGDVGLGVAKLLTCGGLGIWTIVDWFLVTQATKERNAQLLNSVSVHDAK